MNNTRTRLVMAALALAISVAAPRQASAQLPPVVINYSFTIPIVKTIPNPCTGGFVLVNGTSTAAVKTTAASDFTLRLDLTGSGLGQDARADGTLVTDGTQKPNYLYASSSYTETNFPGGTPAYFQQTLHMVEFLKRNSLTATGDSFLMDAVFSVTFTSGVPAAPVLTAINATCG